MFSLLDQDGVGVSRPVDREGEETQSVETVRSEEPIKDYVTVLGRVIPAEDEFYAERETWSLRRQSSFSVTNLTYINTLTPVNTDILGTGITIYITLDRIFELFLFQK